MESESPKGRSRGVVETVVDREVRREDREMQGGEKKGEPGEEKETESECLNSG